MSESASTHAAEAAFGRSRLRLLVSSYCCSRGNRRRKYLQFIALDGLLLGRLLHKVRDEDFQCGSSCGVQRRREKVRAAADGVQVRLLRNCQCAHLPALFFASFLLLAVPVP